MWWRIPALAARRYGYASPTGRAEGKGEEFLPAVVTGRRLGLGLERGLQSGAGEREGAEREGVGLLEVKAAQVDLGGDGGGLDLRARGIQ